MNRASVNTETRRIAALILEAIKADSSQYKDWDVKDMGEFSISMIDTVHGLEIDSPEGREYVINVYLYGDSHEV